MSGRTNGARCSGRHSRTVSTERYVFAIRLAKKNQEPANRKD